VGTTTTRPSDDGGWWLVKQFYGLLRTIGHRTRAGGAEIQLLREVSGVLLGASGPDVVEWWIKKGPGFLHCEVLAGPSRDPQWEVNHVNVLSPDYGVVVGNQDRQSVVQRFAGILAGRDDANGSHLASASLLAGEAGAAGGGLATDDVHRAAPSPYAEFPSFMLIPLVDEAEDIGFLQLKSRRTKAFSRKDVEFCQVVAQTLTMALTYHSTQAKLQERVKELGALYAVVRLAERPGASLPAVLRGAADLIPPAWQYPEITAARLEVDGEICSTPGFRETPWQQSAAIVVDGRPRGRIVVVYLEERPPADEGPFLEEERHLIDGLAQEISAIVDRRQARDAAARLENHLRHADRLATLGKLAAGVAHELNEPLAAILGFAQLAQKGGGLSDAVHRDLGKIVDASLYSRKIVNKLRLFSRQTPPELSATHLNQIIQEGLAFLKSRCATQGIAIVEDLDSTLTPIVADEGQLHQVLVNLVVNAVQAMPGGGTLTIRTRGGKDIVALVVEDTGIGMSEQVQEKIFLPFFTTKDADQGTGLGLSVVHGIVTAHGGTIQVSSEVGRGSRFEVRFPVGGEPNQPRSDLP
jgi:signal transduction histidine kinase